MTEQPGKSAEELKARLGGTKKKVMVIGAPKADLAKVHDIAEVENVEVIGANEIEEEPTEAVEEKPMKQILTIPNPLLRRKCKEIGEVTPDVVSLASDLRELLTVKHHGLVAVSISAPQIGTLLRVLVFRNNPFTEVHSSITMINPVILRADKEVLLKEQCLSIPGKDFWVKRANRIKVRYVALNGAYTTFKYTGIVAQMIQHEMNHLDGILIDEIGKPFGHLGQG